MQNPNWNKFKKNFVIFVALPILLNTFLYIAKADALTSSSKTTTERNFNQELKENKEKIQEVDSEIQRIENRIKLLEKQKKTKTESLEEKEKEKNDNKILTRNQELELTEEIENFKKELKKIDNKISESDSKLGIKNDVKNDLLTEQKKIETEAGKKAIEIENSIKIKNKDSEFDTKFKKCIDNKYKYEKNKDENQSYNKALLECLESTLDVTKKKTLFEQTQIDLKDCQKQQAEIYEKIDCTKFFKNLDQIGKKIITTKVKIQSMKNVDLSEIINLNKQTEIKDAKSFLGTIIDLLVKFIGLTAFVLLVIAGFRMILAAGNDNEIQKAKDMLKYAIFGLVVALLSYLLVALVRAILIT
jgi:hypothetical protein